MAEQINLEGTNWISNIPGVYFDAASQLVEKVGGEASAGKYIGRIGFGTGTVIDLTVNIAQDPDNPGKIIASTIVADGTVYVLGGYFANVLITDVLTGTALAITGVATAPVWLTVASVGVAIAATTYFGSDLKNWIYNDLKNSLSDFEEYGFHSPEIVGIITKDNFIAQSATNDPNFCKNIFPDYVNYRQITEIQSGSESFLYNMLTKDAVISTSQSEKDVAEVIFKNTDADKLTLNNQTYDIKNLSPIQLRNAIEGIDSVSFLLSNILIKVGEKLDLGDKGVYTVKSGDTLSVIAQKNGYVTKDLVKLNPWLFDDNRIEFNYPTKVLVAEGTVISDNNDNSLTGEDTENILIDHNGGNDTLIGGSGEDWLEGGEGYDTYIVNDLDTIKDSDGSGRIVFEGTILTGAKIEDGETEYYSQEDHGTYYLSSDGFTFVSDTGKTLNVITPLDYSEQVLPDGNGGTMTVKTYTGVGITLENFSSPLVLDLNQNGITSVDLYDTAAYFDMDGDGIKEKTGWIEKEDGLLVFDKNQNGIIDNGSELFGNNSYLQNGTKADNGFEALREYDENSDGVIDAKDNAYDALKVWVDANQDGETQTGELKTLEELNITSISLDAKEVEGSEAFNKITHTSTFTQESVDAEGNAVKQEIAINDVWFRNETMDIKYGDTELSDEVKALPQIAGSGRVKDLQSAMDENATLKSSIKTLLASDGNYNNLKSQSKEILALWTHTDNINPNTTRGTQSVLNHNYGRTSPVGHYRTYAYARDVAILEMFAGHEFSMEVDGVWTSDVLSSEKDEIINCLNVTLDVTRIEYNVTLENNTLACGNKKQKIESVNNDFYMLWHVETDMREVA